MIANGHPPDLLGGYTVRQIELYYGQAQRLVLERRMAATLDVNAGMSGGKGLKRYLDAFKKALSGL